MNAVRKVAAQAGVKVRVYIPYGESYLSDAPQSAKAPSFVVGSAGCLDRQVTD
jgi:hypothetical protein